VATETAEQQAPVQTEEVTFVSGKKKDLRLVKKPARKLKDPSGNVYEYQPATDVWFGVESKNEPGYYKTSDPEIIEWLRQHPGNQANSGTDFVEVEGPQKPSVEDQLAAITRAGIDRDTQALSEVVRIEDETHEREQVYDAAVAALQQIQEVTGAESAPSDDEGTDPSTSEQPETS
jgi:hypothetical protein